MGPFSFLQRLPDSSALKNNAYLYFVGKEGGSAKSGGQIRNRASGNFLAFRSISTPLFVSTRPISPVIWHLAKSKVKD